MSETTIVASAVRCRPGGVRMIAADRGGDQARPARSPRTDRPPCPARGFVPPGGWRSRARRSLRRKGAEASTNMQKPQKIAGWAQLMIGSPLSIRDWKRTSLTEGDRPQAEVIQAVLPASQRQDAEQLHHPPREQDRRRQPARTASHTAAVHAQEFRFRWHRRFLLSSVSVLRSTPAQGRAHRPRRRNGPRRRSAPWGRCSRPRSGRSPSCLRRAPARR